MEYFPAIVGRGAQADIILDDSPRSPTISRSHFKLSLASGRLQIEDLSSNGTSIDGGLLQRGRPVLLQTSETVWLGTETAVLVETIRPEPAVNFERPLPQTAEGEAITLEFKTLDSWSVRLGEKVWGSEEWTHRKAFLVLVYLAEASPRSVPIARLWEALWADSAPSGRQGLQTAVSRVRRYLKSYAEANPILFKEQAYCLAPEYGPRIDASDFEQRCSAGRHAYSVGNKHSAEQLWTEAVALYQQDFLEGFNEEWVERRRLQLRRELLATLIGLAEIHGLTETSLAHLRRGLAFDAGWEAGHLGVLTCLLALGRKHEALFHYQECEKTLQRLYGQGPSEPLLRLYHAHLRS